MDEHGRQQFIANTERLATPIRPLSEPVYQCDCRWIEFEAYLSRMGKDDGGVELCPDFQRGHVWSTEQQRHFLESVLKGVVPSAALLVRFNCATGTIRHRMASSTPACSASMGCNGSMRWLRCSKARSSSSV